MNGSMCDFRVYNKALTEEEIHELTLGLIAHYPLNCAPNQFVSSPTVEYDISGKNHMLNMVGVTPNNLWINGEKRYDREDNFTAMTQYLIGPQLMEPIKTLCFWAKLPASLGTGYACYVGNLAQKHNVLIGSINCGPIKYCVIAVKLSSLS